MFPLDYGNSSLTVSVPLDDARDAADDVVRLLTGVGYRGVFSAEFKRDPRDGRAKLLEVNCRPWWFIGFAAHCGIDTTLMIYSDALGLPVASVDDYAVGERCVVVLLDARAYWRTRRSGEVSLRKLLRSWIGATPSTFAIDDPLPTLTYQSAMVRRRVRRLLTIPRSRERGPSGG
jgi:predicted ATP-grasp superfamily ATP-dependent carboligase